MNNEAIINLSFSTFNWLDDDVFENDNDDDSLFTDPLFLFKVCRARVIKYIKPQGIYWPLLARSLRSRARPCFRKEK